jgi:hypothetical protein
MLHAVHNSVHEIPASISSPISCATRLAPQRPIVTRAKALPPISVPRLACRKQTPSPFGEPMGSTPFASGRHRPIPTLVSRQLNDTTGAKKRLEAVREAVQRSPDWAQFELYQGGIARGMLPHAMDDADKYRLMARDLRERAIVPEMAFQRQEVISLAARFEVLAIEADHIQEHLADALFAAQHRAIICARPRGRSALAT